MRGSLLGILLIIIVVTLVLSAVLTPPVYETLGTLLGANSWPFSRVFDRVAMLVLAILVLCFRRAFSLQELGAALKNGSPKRRIMTLVVGLAVSFCSSLLIFPFLLRAGQILWLDFTLGDLAFKTLKLIPAALLISLIEEGFFRVIIFSSFKKRYPLVLAILLCSLLYALAHFIAPDKSYIYPGYSVWVGFDYLGAVFQRFFLAGTWQVFVGLLLVGSVLCVAINSSRSLYLCIGLHAGWVMALKLLNYASDPAKPELIARGVGERYFLLSQSYAWLAILLVMFVVLFSKNRFKPELTKAA